VENSNRDTGAEDIVQFMAALECSKSECKSKWKSRSSTDNLHPSVRGETSAVKNVTNDVNASDQYQHVMSCIHGMSETLSQLVASVKPIIYAWNENKSSDSNEVRGLIDFISSCLNMYAISSFKTIYCISFLLV